MKLRYSIRLLVPIGALVVSLSACGTPVDDDDGGGGRETEALAPERIGRIDLKLGEDEASGVVFGDIADIALDESGRIFVADYPRHTVLVFDSTGTLEERLGGEGDGPGELRGPRFIRIDGASLWVTSDLRGDLERYARTDSGFVADGRISSGRWPPAGRPIVGGDTVFQPVSPRGNTSPGWRRALLPILRTGEILEPRPYPPSPYADSAEVYRPPSRIEFERPGREPIVLEGFGPYVPYPVSAFGPSGERAEAVAVRYLIDLYHPGESQAFHRIEWDIPRPRVTATEREAAERDIQAEREEFVGRGANYTAPPIPEFKPVIRDLWYDGHGRLWVQRWTEGADSLAAADVYSPLGEPLFSARWPEGIDLSDGAARRNVALGIRTSDLDVESVVRVRFDSDGG